LSPYASKFIESALVINLRDECNVSVVELFEQKTTLKKDLAKLIASLFTIGQ